MFILYKWIQCRNDDTEPLKKKFRNFFGNNLNNTLQNNSNFLPNQNNSYNTFHNNISFSNSNSKLAFDHNYSLNLIPTEKITRFVMDYCRTSPNITHIQKDIIDIGWRSNLKYHFSVNVESMNQLSGKVISKNIMTVIPIFNFSLVDFEDKNDRSSYAKLLIDLFSNHLSLIQYTHLDILNTPKFLIAITPFYLTGSLCDLINKNDPLIPYNKKSNWKGAPLLYNQILSFSEQILKGLAYLHQNNWYHLHLHTGNILVNEKEDKCYITDIENCLLDIPIKNEKYLYYIYEFFNNKSLFSQGNGNTNSVLSEIFISIDLFEKIDIVLFGRILYEMTFGKELLSNAPDDLELNELNLKLKQMFNYIFPKKIINDHLTLSLPEKSVLELLSIVIGKSNSECNNDVENEYTLLIEDKYIQLKERIFRQNVFIKSKLKLISDMEIDTNII